MVRPAAIFEYRHIQTTRMAVASDLLFTVPDLPPLIFSWLDPSSLALAACVCRSWRDTARKVRGGDNQRFRLVLAELMADAPRLAWAAANLNEKRLPATLWRGACTLAAKGGHLAVLQWAKENAYPVNGSVCFIAALGGHLAVLRWARENGCGWDERTCANAARGGHLAILQWARQNRCPWDERTCTGAARGGHLAILQWARQNGCPWDERTCTSAARGGYLAVLQWARKNGCEWGSSTCAYAVKGGHLAILQWAREHGCEWDKEGCLEAARNKGHKEVAAWIASQPE